MEERKQVREANTTSFKKGHAKVGGRKPGAPNTMPRLLKECILLAAALEGRDGKGKDGLVGFLRRLANEDVRAFAMLLGRILPLQVESKSDARVNVVYQSVEEVRRELEARGITMETMRQLFDQPSNELDAEHESFEVEHDKVQ